jgi:hypothetical protein
VAEKVRIIDTGQSLGKNIVVKEDKVVPTENADILPSGSPLPAPILGGTTPTSSTDATHQALQEPKVYFTTPSGGVKLHRDEFGQSWLSFRATPTTTTVSVVVMGVIAGLIFYKFFSLYQKGRNPGSNPGGVTQPPEEELLPAESRVQIRRLSL